MIQSASNITCEFLVLQKKNRAKLQENTEFQHSTICSTNPKAYVSSSPTSPYHWRSKCNGRTEATLTGGRIDRQADQSVLDCRNLGQLQFAMYDSQYILVYAATDQSPQNLQCSVS